jgi:hypothetical protein
MNESNIKLESKEYLNHYYFVLPGVCDDVQPAPNIVTACSP